MTVLNVLLVDDDPESLTLLTQSLPETIEDLPVRWVPCGDFDDALRLISDQRFDVVVTDIYRDRSGAKNPVTGDPQGVGSVLGDIRDRRFCPVLLFTDGAFPDEPSEGPFLKLADKSPGNDEIIDKLGELVRTGIPELAHRLHDELDSASATYLWTFLDDNWSTLEANGLTQAAVLDRLLHRRASVQLGRLQKSDEGLVEHPHVEGAEFYLSPSLTKDLRLGQILERDGEFRVVLTPHCHLAVQPGQSAPRAEFVLVAKTTIAADLFGQIPLKGSEENRLDQLRRRIQSPADLGTPRGRYWFLPAFLSMPNLYVDLLQLESLPLSQASDEWASFAVLDGPFAEALQSSFVALYSAVGVPTLDVGRFGDMLEPSAEN